MTADFHGHPVRCLANDHLSLDFLVEAGPRIVGLRLAGAHENLLADAYDVCWDTRYGLYRLYGGHRLWHAPEAPPRSSIPDDTGLEVEEFSGGVRLRQRVEEPTGIRKTLEIALHDDRPAVTIRHILGNEGLWPVELAPWAITMVPLGGMAVLPQAAPAGSPYLPNRQLVLWPYTRFADTRLRLDDDFVLVDGIADSCPVKIGTFNHAGWLGHLWRGVFFCKRFTPQPGRPHADFNCNTEVFCRDRFLEIETLAPLVRLEPDQATDHTELWEFYPAAHVEPTVDGVRALVAELKP